MKKGEKDNYASFLFLFFQKNNDFQFDMEKREKKV